MDLHAHAVTQTVTEAALVAGGVDDVAGDLVDILTHRTGTDDLFGF